MSLPVYLADGLAPAPVGERVACGPDLAGHAVRVRRMRTGEPLQLVDGRGLRITGTITAAAPDALTVEVTACTRDPEPAPGLVLVQALAKQDRDLQAIEAATEVGVDAVVPWAAQRSIADWPAKKQAKMVQRWENTLRAATLQARRSRIPELAGLARGTGLTTAFAPGDHVLVLHEEAAVHLPTALARRPADTARIVLVVGPEGGIAPEEIAACTEAGAVPVRLGDTVLRTSSAGPVGLALCQMLLGRWADAHVGSEPAVDSEPGAGPAAPAGPGATR